MAVWEFYDHVTDSTEVLGIDPRDVDMGGIRKRITEQSAASPTGQRLLFEGRRQPQEMSFSGVTLTKAQYIVFKDWSDKNYQIRVTDDLGRVYWLYITKFSPTRKRNPGEAWLTDYNITATVLDWSS